MSTQVEHGFNTKDHAGNEFHLFAVNRCEIRHIGRFVYVCDAADDLTGDIRAGRYNPLAAGWGSLAVTEDGAMTDLVRGSLEVSLPLDLEGLGRAADRLDAAHPLTPIVRNLVYLGLPASMRRVLYGQEAENGGLPAMTMTE